MNKIPGPTARGARRHKEENQPMNGSMDKSEKSTQKDTTHKENTVSRVVQAIVENTMLYNCQVRTWYMSKINRFQSCVDKCYRSIWSSKRMAPLKEMEQKKKNRWDVRKELGIKSIRMKIEKRSLEGYRQMLRVEPERVVQYVTFDWLKELEKEKKRKSTDAHPGTGTS